MFTVKTFNYTSQIYFHADNMRMRVSREVKDRNHVVESSLDNLETQLTGFDIYSALSFIFSSHWISITFYALLEEKCSTNQPKA